VSGIRQPKHPWRLGFAAGGSVSTITAAADNSLVDASVNAGALAANSYSTAANRYYTLSSTTSGGSKLNQSTIKPGFSYWIGIFGEKPLSARWALDIGLNLHYYSTVLKTTAPVTNYAPSSASLFAATAVTYTGNATSYGTVNAGRSNLNQYYFLELPVAMQWRINRSRVLPVFWRAGAQLSYLMSSNAVYYDRHTGNYERDNAVVRRTQVGLSTGLAFGLPLRGVQIQAGPEVQYGLMSLLTTGGGGGHLVYGGLRVALTR
jgi:hypothetical protein